MNWNVRNLINDRNNPANNQIILEITNDKNEIEERTFVSYGVKIIRDDIKNHKIYISSSWNYSKTTMKHCYIFLRDFNNMSIYNSSDIENAIKTNKIIFVDNIN